MSSEISLGAIPQLIPQPYRTASGTGLVSPVLASIAIMLILRFLAGSLSSWTAQKPSDLLTLELQQTLLSDRGLAVFEIVLGKDTVFLNLPTFFCLPFGSDGPG